MPALTGASAGGRLMAAGLLLAFAAAANAAEVRIDRRYYAVTGKDRAGVAAAVRFNGPRGGSAFGLAFIDFSPEWKVEFRGASCRVVAADVGLDISIILPRWEGRETAPPAVAAHARRFERAIERHEMQHVAIARRYAAEMRNRLLRLPARAQCHEVRAAGKAAIEEVKRRHLAAQRRFDAGSHKGLKRLL